MHILPLQARVLEWGVIAFSEYVVHILPQFKFFKGAFSIVKRYLILLSNYAVKNANVTSGSDCPVFET